MHVVHGQEDCSFSEGAPWGSKHAAAHGKTRSGAAPFQGARPEPVAGLQRARPRESAPAYSWQTGRARAPQGASDGGDPQRARPASGAPTCRGDSKRLGARGSAWPCVSEVAAAACAWFPLSRARACQGIYRNCVNGFATVRKRLVQANACSGRPRRDPPLGCGADGPAQHGPPRGRSRDRALLNLIDARLPRCSGLLPCQCGARRSGVARSSVCCAPRVASGCSAGRSGLSVRRPAALRSLGARRLRFRRCARLLSRESGRTCNPNLLNTLRTHVLQPARFGAIRACGAAHLGVAARVFRAGSSLGRWRCGSCASSPGIGVARAARQATWLILPVVICLSQRLSHACLSISDLYCETANGSLNQLWFL